MKRLFFLLLLANLALFGWLFIGSPGLDDGESEIASLPYGSARLQLLDEVAGTRINRAYADTAGAEPPEVAVASEVAPAKMTEPEPPPPRAFCYAIGPFGSDGDADRMAERLASEGYDTRQRREYVEERFGYWVLLPPYPSRAKAIEVTNKLAELGVKDYFVVLATAKRNAVSLGVFREKRSAERRLEVITALGFQPVIEDRMQRSAQFWLDYRGEREFDVELWSRLGKGQAALQLDEIVCH